MKRLVIMIVATSLALLAFADEHVPTDPAAAPLPGAQQAMVRVVHASPNAELERAALALTGDEAAVDHDFGAIQYMTATDYVPILEGNYSLTVDLTSEDGDVPTMVELPQTLSLARGRYYTVAIIGLVMPEEAEETDDGFMAWLQDLFTADRDDLALQAMLLDDISAAVVGPVEAEVRLLHAAPGTESVDLVFVRADDDVDVYGTVAFGEETGFARLIPDEGRLEVRAAGSDVAVVDLDELEIEGGMLHTIIVTGTPIEDVPLEAMLVSNQWFDPMRIAPGTPGTVAPVAGVMTAAQAEWVRDQILSAETWLDRAEGHLVELAEQPEAEDLVAAARQDIEDARLYLEQARLQLETAAGWPPVQPDTVPDEPADPED